MENLATELEQLSNKNLERLITSLQNNPNNNFREMCARKTREFINHPRTKSFSVADERKKREEVQETIIPMPTVGIKPRALTTARTPPRYTPSASAPITPPTASSPATSQSTPSKAQSFNSPSTKATGPQEDSLEYWKGHCQELQRENTLLIRKNFEMEEQIKRLHQEVEKANAKPSKPFQAKEASSGSKMPLDSKNHQKMPQPSKKQSSHDEKSETESETKSETERDEKSETERDEKSETERDEKSETEHDEKSETERDEKSETEHETKLETERDEKLETEHETKLETEHDKKSETDHQTNPDDSEQEIEHKEKSPENQNTSTPEQTSGPESPTFKLPIGKSRIKQTPFSDPDTSTTAMDLGFQLPDDLSDFSNNLDLSKINFGTEKKAKKEKKTKKPKKSKGTEFNMKDFQNMFKREDIIEEELIKEEPVTEEVDRPAFMNLFGVKASETERKVNKWESGGDVIQQWFASQDENKRGQKKRGKKAAMIGNASQMEDANVVCVPFNNSPGQALFCVFDGHAGKDCALKATKIFPHTFEKFLPPTLDPTAMESAWINTYKSVDDQLKTFEYEGCTSSTVFVWEHPATKTRYVQSANCGDSTAFIKLKPANQSAQVVQLTVDHKPTLPSERKRILALGEDLPEGAKRIGGLAVSRALGDFFAKEEKCGLVSTPDVSKPYPLVSGENLLIVASDGLWDVIDGPAAFEYIEQFDTAKNMARELMKHALSFSACQDNITVIVAIL